MTTREDIARECAALYAEYGPFYDEVLALLFRDDPIGINFETNTDEYDPEVRVILPRLGTCASAEEVASIVHDAFVRLFDRETAGPVSRYERVAAEIWNRWRPR